MSDLSPFQMDRRLTQLAGKLLAGNLTPEETAEQHFLQIERRNTICTLPTMAELLQTRKRSS